MQRKGIFKLLEVLLAIAMLFGWTTMFFKSSLTDPDSLSSFNPVKYGFLIFLVAMPAFIVISPRNKFNEKLSIGTIVFGMFALCQPFTMLLYRCGFQTLLVGTLAFIIVSHK